MLIICPLLLSDSKMAFTKILSLFPYFVFKVAYCHEFNKRKCPSTCDPSSKKQQGGETIIASTSEGNLATFGDIRKFVINCMKKVGTPDKNAEVFADSLLEADYRGYTSHGLNRLGLYVKDIQRNACDPVAVPSVINETVSTAICNGNNGIGAVVATWCMNLAIEKAENTGVGFVSVRGSNHFGVGTLYVLHAAKKGMIGLCFSNTSPVMVPTRAKQPALGTNPLTLAAPAMKNDTFIIDIATTVVSLGKIDMYRRRNEPIPEGWASNPDGLPETDPVKALEYKLLCPLGGTELNSGYKGFGLGFMVEIFSGILSAVLWGKHGRRERQLNV